MVLLAVCLALGFSLAIVVVETICVSRESLLNPRLLSGLGMGIYEVSAFLSEVCPDCL